MIDMVQIPALHLGETLKGAASHKSGRGWLIFRGSIKPKYHLQFTLLLLPLSVVPDKAFIQRQGQTGEPIRTSLFNGGNN
jgi:hypothetical protein